MALTTKARYVCTFKYQASKNNRVISFYAPSDGVAESIANVFRGKLVPGAGCMLTKVLQENLGSDGKIAQNLPASGLKEDASVYLTMTCSAEASNRAGKWVVPFQDPSTVNRDDMGDAIVAISDVTPIAYYDKTSHKVYEIDGFLKSGIGRTSDRFKTVSPDYPPDTGDDEEAPEEVPLS